MFWCYICGDGKASMAVFRAHLNRHGSDYELVRPVRCCQGACKATFDKPYNFFRHLEKCHDSDSFGAVLTAGIVSNNECHDDGLMNTDVSQFCSNDEESASCGIDAVQHEGTLLVASLRANSSIPYSAIPPVIESINAISNCVISACQAEAVKCFDEYVQNSEGNVSRKYFQSMLSSSLKQLKAPLGFLDTKYKQDKYFVTHEKFVQPESVNFGLRYQTKRGKTSKVYDTFEYISIEKTLKSLMQSDSYIHALLEVQKAKVDSDVIDHFYDGQLAQTRMPHARKGSVSVIIQLFYDGMGTTNPLRGQSVMCNVGVFYYVVKNLPESFNSCFANVHLLALCYAHDLKVHKFGPILNKFCDELSTLSTTGFEGVFPILGKATVKVHLGQVSCDNLALNSILGFTESFSGDYFCTLCYATRQDMQVGFEEECFHMRNQDDYNKDVNELNHDTRLHNVRGVKRFCELNTLSGFHVTENFSIDIMHTVLEGVVPLELGCVLFYLIAEKRFFTLDQLNCWVTEFWDQLTVDRKKRPPYLNQILSPGSGLTPSMKATQCWALLKYLPLIIGDVVPQNDQHYMFLLHLSDLVDLLFAPRFTLGTLAYMKEMIKDHLRMFINLFGDMVTLKPKHHFMVHFPTIVKKSGPLTGMSCLRYEMKNSFFKRSSHIVCNFINISKTLAFRHQHFALYSLLSDAHQRNCFGVGKSHCSPVTSVLQGSLTVSLCEVLGVGPADDVAVACKLKRDSSEYQEGQCVVCGFIDDEPVFGELVCFVCRTDDDKWHMVVRSLETVCYFEHFHSFAIRQKIPQTYSIIAFTDLLDYHSLCSFKKRKEQSWTCFVRLPYWIF